MAHICDAPFLPISGMFVPKPLTAAPCVFRAVRGSAGRGAAQDWDVLSVLPGARAVGRQLAPAKKALCKYRSPFPPRIRKNLKICSHRFFRNVRIEGFPGGSEGKESVRKPGDPS